MVGGALTKDGDIVQAALAPSTLLKAIAVGVSGVATACLLMYFSSVTESDRAKTGTATTLTLGHNASSVEGKYVGWSVAIVKGAGEGQTRKVTEYDADNKVVTVDPQWYCDPDATSRYRSSWCASGLVSCCGDSCIYHIASGSHGGLPFAHCIRSTRVRQASTSHVTNTFIWSLLRLSSKGFCVRAPIHPSSPKPSSMALNQIQTPFLKRHSPVTCSVRPTGNGGGSATTILMPRRLGGSRRGELGIASR